jgi:hypothetical protein
VAGDPELEAFVERQIEVETEHVSDMRAFAGAHAPVTLVPPAGAAARRRRGGRRPR